MYNDIIKRLPALTYAELKTLRASVYNEISHRETLEPIGWRCPHCEFTNEVFLEVMTHLQTEHDLNQVRAIYAVKGVFA